MLEIHGLHKSFAGFRAVNDVSLTVEARQIVAVIGPNGAGKSTFFNLITGHLRPDAGRVVLGGRDITGLPPHRICGLGMGRSFQLHQHLSPPDGAGERAGGIARPSQARPRLLVALGTLFRDDAEALLASIGLAALADATAGTLAYGNQKQLELGIALASDPSVLLLDEPTAGMSAGETHETISLLQRIAAERGLTLLFTEHDMAVVFGVAEKIAVLYQGRKLAEGAPEAVRANPEVRRVYLGEHA